MSSLFVPYRPDAHGDPIAVTIRELVGADVEACAAIATERNGGHRDAWAAALSGGLGSPDHGGFVAVVDGDVVGYATAGWLSPHAGGGRRAPDGWYLTGLTVATGFRRRGIGRALTLARLAVSYTHLDVYKRQVGDEQRTHCGRLPAEAVHHDAQRSSRSAWSR